MKPRCFVLPASLLLLAWCEFAPPLLSAEGAPPPARKEEVRAAMADLDGVSLPGITSTATGSTADKEGLRARMDELRARVAAGDSDVGKEVRAIVEELGARADSGDPDVTVTRSATDPERVRVTIVNRSDSHGAGAQGRMDQEAMRARLAELRARAAAGDPQVTVTTTTVGSEEARAKLAELHARAAAGDSTVTITHRSTGSRPAVQMTDEERARRQAYVASHPELPPRSKASILAGLVLLAMKLQDVEQLLGPLQPVEGRLPNGEVPDADVKVYTAQERGQTVYLFFRDGKLLRR